MNISKNQLNIFYEDQVNRAKESQVDQFWLLFGRNLTLGLFKYIASNEESSIPVTQILKFYQLDSNILFRIVIENESDIPEFAALKPLANFTFKKMQEKNHRLFLKKINGKLI